MSRNNTAIKSLNRSTVSAQHYPVKILQFGEGNFLRAFVDWMIFEMNKKAHFNAGVVAVQPINQGLINLLNEQDGLYTLYLNGIKNGQAISEHQLIDCIQRGIDPYKNYAAYIELADNPDLRFIVSNTTEAGIAFNEEDKLSDSPPSSFPAKLTALLHRRFKTFSEDSDQGLIIIPCELIDRNGDKLKSFVLQYAEAWNLGKEFCDWVEHHNIFCNTLVDRIVPGFPKSKIDDITEELGYEDKLVVEGEQFHLWVIEGPDKIKEELPTEVVGLNVVFTNNMEPYRTRKVRILNGAHTSMVPVAYLYGIETVREAVDDPVVGEFVKQAIFDDICPTLDLSEDELISFANDVLDRFRNPYLQHELMSIALNSVSKFKTRVLPSILEYQKRTDSLPEKLIFSLGALIIFYKGEYEGKTIALNDGKVVIEFFNQQWSAFNSEKISLETLTTNVLSNVSLWGINLNEIPGLTGQINRNLQDISNLGITESVENIIAI